MCLAIWRKKPTRDLFEVQRFELSSTVASNPGNVAFLCVVEPKADAPDQEVRDASSAMITSHGKKLAACACVIEGDGFRAAITRTVLSGIALVTRSPSPTRFFEGVPDASHWLNERLRLGEASAIAEQVELARKRLDGPTWR